MDFLAVWLVFLRYFVNFFSDVDAFICCNGIGLTLFAVQQVSGTLISPSRLSNRIKPT